MNRKRFVFLIIVTCFFLLVLILGSFLAIGKTTRTSLESLFIPVSKNFRIFTNSSDSKLKEENKKLLKQTSDYEALKRENSALSDQFKTSYPSSSDLLPTHIIGAIGFIPSVTLPQYFIVDKGEVDGVKKGAAVVVKDAVFGKVAKTSSNLSIVFPLYHKDVSIQAKTTKGTHGIAKGEGSSIVFDTVLIADPLSKNDIVVTGADVGEELLGFPPDLVIGTVESVNKKASSLFQSGHIVSPLDFSNLETVFIISI